jgi:AcrR family transcriptional regulator
MCPEKVSGPHKGGIDRRVARTRTVIQDAFVSLVLERGYDPITIKDICDAANVARATFYSHYRSKDDLKRAGLGHLRNSLLTRRRDAAGNGSLSFSLAVFEHARDHLHLYRALAGSRGGAIALETIREIVVERVRADLTASRYPLSGDSGDTVASDLVVQFVAGAFMALLTGWLDTGAKAPPARMDDAFRRLTTKGIVALLPPTNDRSAAPSRS